MLSLFYELCGLVIFTGRSQGYVELLAQSLGMINHNFDLPFVIENGSALYFPASKKTIILLNNDQRELIKNTQRFLVEELNENEFEPKTYMITINPVNGQTVETLSQEIVVLLTEKNILNKLNVNSSNTAVDITSKEINKLSGINKMLDEYYKLYPNQNNKGFENIVAIGDSTSDLCVMEKMGKPYCAAQNVAPEVKCFVEEKYPNHVIDANDIDCIISVIEKECRIQLI